MIFRRVAACRSILSNPTATLATTLSSELAASMVSLISSCSMHSRPCLPATLAISSVCDRCLSSTLTSASQAASTMSSPSWGIIRETNTLGFMMVSPFLPVRHCSENHWPWINLSSSVPLSGTAIHPCGVRPTRRAGMILAERLPRVIESSRAWCEVSTDIANVRTRDHRSIIKLPTLGDKRKVEASQCPCHHLPGAVGQETVQDYRHHKRPARYRDHHDDRRAVH